MGHIIHYYPLPKNTENPKTSDGAPSRRRHGTGVGETAGRTTEPEGGPRNHMTLLWVEGEGGQTTFF